MKTRQNHSLFVIALFSAALTLPALQSSASACDDCPSENIQITPMAGGDFMLAEADTSKPNSAVADDAPASHNGHYHVSRPDGHAPIGVMGDHMHQAGEVMFSYRFMQMHMDGNRDGGSSVSTSEVLSDYLVSPTKMDMRMHMLGVMYAPIDAVTLVLMGTVVDNEMDHRTRSGVRFTTKARGFGDTRATALVKLWEQANHSLHFNAGLSFPTGSTDKQDDTPMGPNQKLPYPMQLGSGTYDLLPGLTYNGQDGDLSWGAQSTGTVRIGENSDDYTLGNRANATAWSGMRWSEAISTSLRLDYNHWENIDGVDSELPPPSANIVPTADPDLRGGDRLDMLVGANVYAGSGALKGHRLAFEFGFPIMQDLNGPQLETDWLFTLGWQYSR